MLDNSKLFLFGQHPCRALSTLPHFSPGVLSKKTNPVPLIRVEVQSMAREAVDLGSGQQHNAPGCVLVLLAAQLFAFLSSVPCPWADRQSPPGSASTL